MKKLLFTLLLVCLSIGVQAQTQYQKDSTNLSPTTLKARLGTSENPSLPAFKIQDEGVIQLDGILNEAVWEDAIFATNFTQRSPNDGKPASEQTEVRVAYSGKAIYIGIMAYDSAPDSVLASLFRRDGSASSDWVYVNIDSYNDKRTAFTFAINPRGVQKDILYYDDTGEDILWDAVWEAETQIMTEGWSAELRIPLSQLRFSTDAEVQSWGINFQRRIARFNEVSYWAPTSQNESGVVSKFGTLNEVTGLEKPKRLEVIPYVSGSTTHAPLSSTQDPYYNEYDYSYNIGGDIKYGLTSDFTLTATINPDFGQVEADPATINLSAFETYFSERRPFFLEGSDIFSFGRVKSYNWWGNPETFYSRRIGRSPQGNLGRYNTYNGNSAYSPDNVESSFTNQPDQTTIASAVKISGKTKSGWSVGLLDAYTVKEKSSFKVNQGGGFGPSSGSFTVEPATNYLVGRTKKDINEGNTVVGGFISAANRSIDNSYFETYLHKSAYIGGFDFEHNWNKRNWTLSGTFSASQVNGTAESILQTQRSSVRYYNRIDSDYLSIDSAKTSLSGYASALALRKSGGGHWSGSVTYSGTHPGYEANDLGFQNRADYHSLSTSVQYQETDPKKLRYYELWNNMSWGTNFDGDVIGNDYNVGGYWEFQNQWSFNMNLNYSGKQYQDRLTRGGPIAAYPNSYNVNFNINTNRAKKVSFNVGNSHRIDDVNEFDHYYWGGITIRPTTFIQFEIESEMGFEMDIDQYILTVEDPYATATYGKRYVFSDLHTTYLSTNIRLDWTFSPKISLQTYLRPYIVSGDYNNFKEFRTPGEIKFDTYGVEKGNISENDGKYTVDPDGSGPSDTFEFNRNDFNYRSLQGNFVFRWEYKPGSALFLVWQHQRDITAGYNNFRFGRDVGGLFEGEPTDIFLVKLSYWFGS